MRRSACQTLIAALAVAAAMMLALAAAAVAQDRDDRYFMLRDPFRAERNYVPQMRGSRPVIIDVPSREARPLEGPETEMRGTTYSSVQEATTARTKPPLATVAVIGDSLGEPLADGLADAFVQDLPEVAVLKKARDGSSLGQAAQYDWVAKAGEMLQAEPVTVGVMLIGINERQAIKDETGALHEPRSEKWVELYGRRIDDVIAQFKSRNIPLFWVGLPAMQSQRLTEDMRFYNEILREKMARAGVPFIDVWDGFVDEGGQFSAYGPALDGQTRRLRGVDGIHFTRAGGRKLAHFVERDLRVFFESRLPRTPAVSDEQAPAGAGAAAATAPQATPQRPDAGPVIPLVGGQRGAGGALAGASTDRTSRPGDPIARSVLVRGEAAPSVAGRADDFRWNGTPTPEPPPEGGGPRPNNN